VILVDSSAWVEFDRATESSVDLRLTKLIEEGGQIVVTEPVIMEVASGARTDSREMQLRRMLAGFELLQFDVIADFEGATKIYRTCRQAGITPRGMIDCMIASVAWRHGASLLARDVDMARMAKVVGIEIDPGSTTSGIAILNQPS
jgi:predicted nucleic acid-binding protein